MTYDDWKPCFSTKRSFFHLRHFFLLLSCARHGDLGLSFTSHLIVDEKWAQNMVSDNFSNLSIWKILETESIRYIKYYMRSWPGILARRIDDKYPRTSHG